MAEMLDEIRDLLEEGRDDDALARLGAVHPADRADVLDRLSDEQTAGLLRRMSSEEMAAVLNFLDDEKRAAAVSAIDKSVLAGVLDRLQDDVAADIIQDLPPEELPNVLKLMAHGSDVEDLLQYTEDSAGGLMTSDVVALQADWTVGYTIDFLRTQRLTRELPYYLYVVDEGERLLGVVSLRHLITAAPETLLRAIMLPDVKTVPVDADQEAVAETMRHYGFLALPVVDSQSRLLGMVTADDILDVQVEEATEDIQKMGGQQALDEPYLQVGFLPMLGKRAGWLAVLFIGEMLTATAMGHYEDEIARAVVLTLFIPLIISSGGNSGSQASTLVIRAMALREVLPRDWLRVMLRELASGLALGTILGTLGFLRVVGAYWLFGSYAGHQVLLAFTVFFSLVGVVLCGTLSGSMLPFVLRLLRFDPASASAPFVATLVDVTGLVIYFTVASVILRGILL